VGRTRGPQARGPNSPPGEKAKERCVQLSRPQRCHQPQPTLYRSNLPTRRSRWRRKSSLQQVSPSPRSKVGTANVPPRTQTVNSGRGESPSAEAQADQPPGPSDPANPARARQNNGATKAPGGKQNSACDHPRRVQMVVGLKRDDPKENRLLKSPIVC
jgi:hypothetical protein